MKNYFRIAIISLFALVIVVGCSTDDKSHTDGQTNNKEQDRGEVNEVNLYSGKDRPTNLLDVEHIRYEPIENIDYDSINYINENIFITAGMGYDKLSHAFELETNERIWQDDIRVKIDGHLEAPIYDDLLYYRNGEEKGAITLNTDQDKNEAMEIEEEEYRIRASEHVYGENSYIVEEDNDNYKLISYNMDTLEEQWEFPLDDYSSIRGEIIETGDYILLDTGEFQVFVLDKENGEALFEEGDKNFYNDAIQVEDKLYAVNVNGLTGEFLTLYAIDTNTWEKEEILSYTNDNFLASTTDVTKLAYEAGKLLFIYEYGAYIIDLETKQITHDYIYVDEEADNVFAEIVSMHSFTHKSKLYTFFEHDYHKTLSIIDIETGDVLNEYGFGLVVDEGYPIEYRIPSPGNATKAFEKISEEKFVIVTQEDGIFEYEFAEIE